MENASHEASRHSDRSSICYGETLMSAPAYDWAHNHMLIVSSPGNGTLQLFKVSIFAEVTESVTPASFSGSPPLHLDAQSRLHAHLWPFLTTGLGSSGYSFLIAGLYCDNSGWYQNIALINLLTRRAQSRAQGDNRWSGITMAGSVLLSCLFVCLFVNVRGLGGRGQSQVNSSMALHFFF